MFDILCDQRSAYVVLYYTGQSTKKSKTILNVCSIIFVQYIVCEWSKLCSKITGWTSAVSVLPPSGQRTVNIHHPWTGYICTCSNYCNKM